MYKDNNHVQRQFGLSNSMVLESYTVLPLPMKLLIIASDFSLRESPPSLNSLQCSDLPSVYFTAPNQPKLVQLIRTLPAP